MAKITPIREMSLAIARRELEAGVHEEPLGSNTGKRIREYLAPCVRGNEDKPLNLKSGNWCAAFVCFCHYNVETFPGYHAHGYRASVVEILNDVASDDWSKDARFVPPALVRNGKAVVNLGDLAIYDRSVAGKPETSWFRHVDIVSSPIASDGTYTAIGGNEGNMVREQEESLHSGKLLGFVLYEGAIQEYEGPLRDRTGKLFEFSEEEKREILANVAIVNDQLIRNGIWNPRS